MKEYRIVFALLVCLLVPSYVHASLGDLRLSLVEGDVQINTTDTEEWVAASINTPLREGDRLWVPEGGKAEIQARDGTYVRLNENTSLDILSFDEDSSQFMLNQGRAYVNYKGLRDNLFQMDTPGSTLQSYEKSKFDVRVMEEGASTAVSVFTGVVYSENKNGKTTVPAGKILVLKDGAYADLKPMAKADNWDLWNLDKDKMLAGRSTSSRYLPEELSTYSSEFDRNGRWVYERDYGYVWTPTVVAAGWAPYRFGRWAWVGGDYVWISYDPWGWTPHHYGRWAYGARIGWFWVPPFRRAVYWGPGFVGWVHTPTYVSWVPLAPREIYYGHGYYGPFSVNIINVNVNRIVVRNVYRNVHVHNAVTIVHRDTFVHGRRVDVNVKDNPFLRERINIGRPDIKPERETRRLVIRDVPQAKQPPARVRDVQVRELRERHPLIKERDESVVRQRQTVAPAKREAKPQVSREPGRPSEGRSPVRPSEVRPPEKGKPQEARPPESRGVSPTGQKPAVETPGKVVPQPPAERKVEPPAEQRQPEAGSSQGRIKEQKQPVEKKSSGQRGQKPAQERERDRSPEGNGGGQRSR
jgi:hypothetical protein